MHPGQHLADRDDATPGCMTRLHDPVLPVERQRYQEDDARTTSHVISQPRLAAPGCRTLRWRRFCIAGGRQSLPLHRRRGVGAVHGMLVVLVCARWAEAAWLRPILASRSHALSMAVADVSANGAPTQAGTCAECGLPGCPRTATVLSCVVSVSVRLIALRSLLQHGFWAGQDLCVHAVSRRCPALPSD